MGHSNVPDAQVNSVSSTTQAAVVTGGGRGIGRSIALRLATEGAVIAVGRSLADLESLTHELHPHEIIPLCGDVTDPQLARDVVGLAHERGLHVKHVVHNAGIGKSGPTENFDVDLWKSIFAVNVHALLYLAQAFVPDMLAQGSGTITVMSSLAGVEGVPYDAAYCASKHAVVGLVRSMALEYRETGIGVYALCPSYVESDMTTRTIQGLMRRKNIDETEARSRIERHCPSGRILAAEEIAETVAALGRRDVSAALTLAKSGGYPILGSTEVNHEGT